MARRYKQKGYIGVDFDKTLATYEKWVSPSTLGEPIPEMVERVKKWLSEGKLVKIFTARVAPDHPINEQVEAEQAIKMWCKKHLGQELEVTCIKYSAMYEFWDDRAVAVEPNTGKRLT
jgi:hypothetical protein